MIVLITASTMLIIVVIFEIYGYLVGSYKRVEGTTGGRLKYLLHPGAAAMSRMLEKCGLLLKPDYGEHNRAIYQKLYVGQNYKEISERKRLDMIASIFLIIIITSVISLAVRLDGINRVKQLRTVNRPENGTEALSLEAVYENESYKIEIELNEKYPTPKEMLDRINSTEAILEKAILGDNHSLSEVRSDLNLKDSYNDTGVKVRWISSDTSLLHSDGTVKNQDIYSAKEVTLKAVISCYEESKEKEIALRIVPEGQYSANKALLVKCLEDSLLEMKGEDIVTFPEQIKGKEVGFYTIHEDNSGKILVIGLLSALLIIPLWYEKRRAEIKSREIQLINDYPEFVSKLLLLLEAGINIRSALERIASDYKRRQKGKNRYVYEELLITCNELSVGKGETEAYETFGRRCGNVYYIRLSALLAQNIKKGGESLLLQLRKEVLEAHKEKQLAVRKKGEETGMKLLVPMMGMFVLVITIILVPAFMSM